MCNYRRQACGLAGRDRDRRQNEATVGISRQPVVVVAVDLKMSVPYRGAAGSRVFVADRAREFTDCRASSTRSLLSPIKLLELHERVIEPSSNGE